MIRKSLLLAVLLAAGWSMPAPAAVETFPAGSLVIPVDPCWQPAGDQPAASGCLPGGSPAGWAGAYGLVYRLQRAGVPVYQVAAPLPEAATAAAVLSLLGVAGAPVTLLPGETPLDPPGHWLTYRAAPFVVDGRDLNPAAAALLGAARDTFRHRVRQPFSASVARVYTGLPTRLLASDRLAAAALADSLALAGLDDAGGIALDLAETAPVATAGTAVSSCSVAAVSLAPGAGSCGLPALLADLAAVPTTTAPRETVRTAPVVADGILYTASSIFPGQSGHLRAIALDETTQPRLWDAAEKVPPPGSGVFTGVPADVAALEPNFASWPDERLLFTNLGERHGFPLITLTAAAAAVLQPVLDVASVPAAAALINALRGRVGASPALPAGRSDRSPRLGGISRSSPVLVGASPVDNAAAERDQVLYVGGEDGLLHAILAGRHQASGRYAHEAPECGSELWGYLPGSLLPDLNGQPFDDATALTAIHVDGTPRVRELFIDDDGDGQREWRTVLIGTASSEAANRGGVFALDVSDPYRPRLLWEAAFDGLGPGRSRGTALGGADVAPRVYVTAATTGRVDADGVATSGTGSYGAMACALDLADGQRLWQFVAPYSGAAANVAEPPSLPAVMTAAASGGVDGVVFGDLAGRLWLLDAASGAPLGGRPVWVTPGGEREPIGGGIALHNRLALFGTGAVTYADGTDAAAVYAVEILPEGGRLLWSVPLAAGEVMWGAPAFDRFGRAYLGVGTAADDRGRLLVIDPGGGLAAEVPLSGVPGGTPALGNGTVVVVSRSGAVELIGEPYQPPAAELSPAGRVRLFSWRVR